MAERGPRHRFELTRLEIGGVIVSAAATLFVVFLLGVYAGRGMDGGESAADQQLVRKPVVAATGDVKDSDALTFDETLANRAGDAEERLRREVADAKAKAAPQRRDSPQNDEADAEASGARAGAAPPAGGEAARIAAAKEPAASSGAGDAAAKPERGAAANPSPTPKARIAVALASAVPPAAGARGEWSVQVTATRDPRTAEEMVKRLKGRGYHAYVQRVQRREGTMYRVRVGRYPSMDEANRIVSRLRREPGVPEAFVASD